MLVALLVVCTVWLYWLRRQIICRTFRAIYQELKKRRVELSPYEMQLLQGQLAWNQGAILEREPQAELRAVKEQYVRSLEKFLLLIRTCLWILFSVGVGAVFLLVEN
jgi:hypothetical protein